MPGADDPPASGDATTFDVVVIGGGLAGLTAGLFCARFGRATLVLEPAVPGGQLVNLAAVEDFPGFLEGIPGFDLGPMVQEQAEREGARFAVAAVSALAPDTATSGRAGGAAGWRVTTDEGTFSAPAVIVASGARPRPLGVPGEEALIGRGVSHCATCDGPLFSGRTVGVAGVGEGAGHAVNEAVTLAGYGGRVVLLHAGAAPPGDDPGRRRLAALPNVEVRPEAEVLEVLGDGAVSGVRWRDAAGAESRLDLAALFVYAGGEPNTDFLRGLLPLAPDGRIPTDARLATALPGIFAAGDVRQGAAGYAVTAAGDGASAATGAHHYLLGRP